MIPRSALWLGIAGLLPFFYGVYQDFTAEPPMGVLAVFKSTGDLTLSTYGTIILAFMSGVLWGFATKSEKLWPYALSVIPALWAFFTGGDLLSLAVGFTALLCLDLLYYRQGLTPLWWMKLRLTLTCIVVACLLIGVFA